MNTRTSFTSKTTSSQNRSYLKSKKGRWFGVSAIFIALALSVTVGAYGVSASDSASNAVDESQQAVSFADAGSGQAIQPAERASAQRVDHRDYHDSWFWSFGFGRYCCGSLLSALFWDDDDDYETRYGRCVVSAYKEVLDIDVTSDNTKLTRETTRQDPSDLIVTDGRNTVKITGDLYDDLREEVRDCYRERSNSRYSSARAGLNI